MDFPNQAETIKRIRRLLGFSQVEFAKSIGLGSAGGQQISNVEMGECGFPIHAVGPTVKLFPVEKRDKMLSVLKGAYMFDCLLHFEKEGRGA